MSSIEEQVLKLALKLAEFIPKYSWPIIVLSSIVLFIPEAGVTKLGLLDLRNNYKGYWVIALILSSSLSLGLLVPKWVKSFIQTRDQKRSTAAYLASLDDRELAVVRWCLLNNTQTVMAILGAATLQSLVAKGIMYVSGTNILSLSYIVRPDAWSHINKKRKTFLPKNVANDPNQVQAIRRFVDRQRDVISAND